MPVRGRTHGFADHPDVVVAAEIARAARHRARRAGRPPRPGSGSTCSAGSGPPCWSPTGCCPRSRTWAAPIPAASPRGHRGRPRRRAAARRLRRDAGRRPAGGCARLAPARRAARSAELLRRLTTQAPRPAPPRRRRRVRGQPRPVDRRARPRPAARARRLLPGQPGRPLVGGRPAGVPARERLVQPLFDDRVVLAARAVPLADRISGALSAAVLAELCPPLTDVPLAGKPPAGSARPPSTGAASTAARSRRSCATTPSTRAPPAASSTW